MQLENVIPPVKLADAVELVELVVDIVPAKTSEEGRVTLGAC